MLQLSGQQGCYSGVAALQWFQHRTDSFPTRKTNRSTVSSNNLSITRPARWPRLGFFERAKSLSDAVTLSRHFCPKQLSWSSGAFTSADVRPVDGRLLSAHCLNLTAMLNKCAHCVIDSFTEISVKCLFVLWGEKHLPGKHIYYIWTLV